MLSRARDPLAEVMIRAPAPEPTLASMPTDELLAEIDRARARILEAARYGRQATASVQRLHDLRECLKRRFIAQRRKERRPPRLRHAS